MIAEKWEATGNDFYFVEADSKLQEQFDVARVVSHCRRRGHEGADGVVFYQSTSAGRTRMTIVNCDGSLGSMCGNALRCLAEILWRKDGRSVHQVELPGRLAEVHSLEPGAALVVIGEPTPQGLEPLFASVPAWDDLLGGTGHLLSFGNPHYVVPSDKLPEDWMDRGRAVQEPAHRLLGTNGINVGFLVTQADHSGIHQLRVYERGAGATQSCGSGACAASAVLESKLRLMPPHKLELSGGVLTIGRSETGYTLAGSVSKLHEEEWTVFQ